MNGTPKQEAANRVWADGCYDMVHFGHANQLRQAKQFGKRLVVGVHNDAEITIHKGPPVFNEQERYRMVRAIRWVDEVVEDAPYATTLATLDAHDCDFCVHGDDITLTADGVDTYAEVKNAKRYKECKRTAGISTTDLVGRMLLLTKSHHNRPLEGHEENATELSKDQQAQSPWTRVSHFMATSQTILQFAQGHERHPGDRVVYVCGAFDLFHIGHLAFLEEAKKFGDYLIVGIFSDQDVNAYKRGNHPIMSLHERVLSVLAYKPVDEVVIGAPTVVTDDVLDRFGVDVVIDGSRVSHHEVPDRFLAAKRRRLYMQVDSGSDMTTEMVIQRIIDHRSQFESRNNRKERREMAAFQALKDQDDTSQVVVI